MQSIRAISLDLDDTLWAIGPVIQRAEALLYGWLHERYPAVAGHTDPGGLHALRVAVMADHPHRHHDYTFLRREMLLRLARNAGCPDRMADEAFAAFSRWRNELSCFEDVQPALTRLASRYRLVALTNGNADLAAIGIDHLFHHAIAARQVGAPKPDRRMFQAALDQLGLAPHEVLHVGDDPRDDVAGAREAGMRCVWMDRFGRPWPADLVPADWQVRNLGQLVELLAATVPGL